MEAEAVAISWDKEAEARMIKFLQSIPNPKGFKLKAGSIVLKESEDGEPEEILAVADTLESLRELTAGMEGVRLQLPDYFPG